MKEKLVITLYDSFTNIDDRFLQEVAVVNVNIKMLEKWKIIMYVFATLLQPASLSGTVHL